jgi:iron complex outermembrane recepter protein
MRRKPTSLIAVLPALVAGGLYAQDTPSDDATIPVAPVRAEAEAVPAVQLDEMMVTAQKRVESLQATPISIEAFSKDTIEVRGIEGLEDLSGNVPNLTIEPFPTHNATLRLFIRGVGINDAQLTQDAAVGVYLDGVYIARSVGLALDIAELERIEVLRGPQGTLYGRNTTGGAVNLITRRPQPGAFDMSHKLSLGNRGYALGRSMFNLPVGDDLALKLSLLGSRKDGYVDNTGPGPDFGDRDEAALRLDARWLPLDSLTVDYAFEFADMNYVNYMFQATQRPTVNKGQGETFKDYAESQTVYSEERLRALAASAPMETSGTRIKGHTLTLTAPLGEHELKYVGGYRDLRDAEYADLGGGAGSTTYRLDSHAYDGPAADAAHGGPTPLVVPTVTQSQWSHELQLSGRLFGGAVEYVAGLFHFTEEGVEDRHHLNHQVSTALSLNEVDELSASFPFELDTVFGPLGIDNLNELDQVRLVNFVDFWWSIDNSAKAAFVQATWTPDWLDERLHLTAGFRHSDDKRAAVKYRTSDNYLEFSANGTGISPPQPISSGEVFNFVPASRRFKDDSWSFVAAFDLSERASVYLKSSEAYKSGGFNVRDPNVSGATSPQYGFGFTEGFAPEYVHAYEAGLKSEWFGRRLRVNASVFDADYTDMQINFLIPGTISDTKVRNAGKARMRGLELETTAALARGLTLLADYAWLDAEVLEARNIVTGENEAHLYPFTSAPRHSYVAAVDWTFLERGWGALRANLSRHYTAERQGIVIAEERRGLTRIDAYGLWSARLSAVGLRFGERGSLDLALWGKNLADKVYPLIAIDNVPQANRAVVWGEPRSFGLDLIYRYH